MRASLSFTSTPENKGVCGVALGGDHSVERDWSIGDLGADGGCVSRWSGVPLDTVETGGTGSSS